MQSTAITTPDEYYEQLSDHCKEAMLKLRKEIKKNIPKGFKEVMAYGMPSFVVPHSLYSPGYHCDPTLPLWFMSIASHKNFTAVYHMGIYADPKLMDWFTTEYAKQVPNKLDMGKSCIRFKKPENIPFKLIGELASKMTVNDWIEKYESVLGDRKPVKKKK